MAEAASASSSQMTEAASKELRRAQEELALFASRLATARKELREAEGRLHPLELRCDKLFREKELISQHMVYIDSALVASRKDLSDVRKASSDSALEKDWALSSLNAELESSRLRICGLEDKAALQAERIGSFLEQISTLERNAAVAYSEKLAEVDKMQTTIDLYKQSYDDVLSRLESLERQGSAFRENSAAQVVDMQAAFQEQLRSEKESAASYIQQLEDQIRELQTAQSTSAGSMSSAVVIVPPTSDLDITELYNRAVRAEAEISFERVKRREAEECLENTAKEMERKLPSLANQRREYLRLKERHDKVTQQLNVVLTDCMRLRDSLQKAEASARDSSFKVSALSQQNKDLSEQVKHLLKQTLRVAIPDENDQHAHNVEGQGDIVSKYLLTFGSIDELQDKNMKLLGVLRRLSDQQRVDSDFDSMDEGRGEDGKVHNSFSETLSELQRANRALQAAQDRALELLDQRDTYKILAEQAGLVPSETISGERHELQQQYQVKVLYLEDELKKVSSSATESKKALLEQLEKEKTECSAFRLQLAHNQNELRVAKESALTSDERLQKSTVELNRLIQRYSDMEKKVLELQSAAVLKDRSFEDMTNSLQFLDDYKRRAEMELAVCKSNENSLEQEVERLQQESKRQASIILSLGNFETTLTARLDEEKKTLTHERDSLAKEVEGLQRQLFDRSAASDQRAITVESDLKSCRAELEKKSTELNQARLNLVKEQNSTKIAAERCSVFERQLVIAQESFAAARGLDTLDPTMLQISAERAVAVERAQLEINDLKNQLKAAEVHTEQFRKIAEDNEGALKSLHTHLTETKELYNAEMLRSATELRATKESFAEFRSTHGEAINELDSLRAFLQENKLKLEQITSQQHEESIASKQALELSSQREEELKAEVWRLQQAAKIAYMNYEREKELHGKAESERVELQNKLAAAQERLSAVEQKFAEISADVIAKERSALLEESKLKREAADNASKLESLQRTRDLLFSQIQTLEAKVSRFEEESRNESTGTVAASSSEASADQEGELQELRRGAAELREVLYFIKRERDVLDSKLTASETESARYQAALSASQKALEETRAMLKRESDKLASMRDEGQFEQLLSQVSTLNQVTELNKHLRKENSDMSARMALLQKEVAKMRGSVAPLEAAVDRLTTEKNGLQKENTQLHADASHWKERIEHLLSRYKDVDPEDHRSLQENFNTAKLEIAERDAAIVSKEEKIGSLKTTYDNLDKIANGLRNKLRDWKKQLEDTTRKLTETSKEAADSKEQVEELTRKVKEQKEIIDSQAATLAANSSTSIISSSSSVSNATAVITASSSTSSSAPAVADNDEGEVTEQPATATTLSLKKRPAPDQGEAVTEGGDVTTAADEYLKSYKELLKKNRSESVSKGSAVTGGTPIDSSEQQALKKPKFGVSTQKLPVLPAGGAPVGSLFQLQGAGGGFKASTAAAAFGGSADAISDSAESQKKKAERSLRFGQQAAAAGPFTTFLPQARSSAKQTLFGQAQQQQKQEEPLGDAIDEGETEEGEEQS